MISFSLLTEDDERIVSIVLRCHFRWSLIRKLDLLGKRIFKCPSAKPGASASSDAVLTDQEGAVTNQVFEEAMHRCVTIHHRKNLGGIDFAIPPKKLNLAVVNR